MDHPYLTKISDLLNISESCEFNMFNQIDDKLRLIIEDNNIDIKDSFTIENFLVLLEKYTQHVNNIQIELNIMKKNLNDSMNDSMNDSEKNILIDKYATNITKLREKIGKFYEDKVRIYNYICCCINGINSVIKILYNKYYEIIEGIFYFTNDENIIIDVPTFILIQSIMKKISLYTEKRDLYKNKINDCNFLMDEFKKMYSICNIEYNECINFLVSNLLNKIKPPLQCIDNIINTYKLDKEKITLNSNLFDDSYKPSNIYALYLLYDVDMNKVLTSDDYIRVLNIMIEDINNDLHLDIHSDDESDNTDINENNSNNENDEDIYEDTYDVNILNNIDKRMTKQYIKINTAFNFFGIECNNDNLDYIVEKQYGEFVKKYREFAKKYHPDINQQGLINMKKANKYKEFIQNYIRENNSVFKIDIYNNLIDNIKDQLIRLEKIILNIKNRYNKNKYLKLNEYSVLYVIKNNIYSSILDYITIEYRKILPAYNKIITLMQKWKKTRPSDKFIASICDN